MSAPSTRKLCNIHDAEENTAHLLRPAYAEPIQVLDKAALLAQYLKNLLIFLRVQFDAFKKSKITAPLLKHLQITFSKEAY